MHYKVCFDTYYFILSTTPAVSHALLHKKSALITFRLLSSVIPLTELSIRL